MKPTDGLSTIDSKSCVGIQPMRKRHGRRFRLTPLPQPHFRPSWLETAGEKRSHGSKPHRHFAAVAPGSGCHFDGVPRAPARPSHPVNFDAQRAFAEARGAPFLYRVQRYTLRRTHS